MRKSRLILIFIALILITTTACAETSKSATRATLQPNCVYDTQAVHELTELIWKVELEEPVYRAIVIGDGRLYSTMGDILRSGGFHVRALNLETGEEIWTFEVGERATIPVVAEGVIFVGGGPVSFGGLFGGNLYAIDAETGQEKWKFRTDGDVEATPWVDGESVYVLAEHEHSQVVLYAIGAKTGQEKWQVELGEEDGWSHSLIVDEGLVYIGRQHRIDNDVRMYRLQAVSTDTGQEVWSRSLGKDAFNQSIIFSEKLFHTGNDKAKARVERIDKKSGESKDVFETPKIFWQSAIYEETIYSQNDFGGLTATSIQDGREIWSINPDEDSSFFPNPCPVIADGVVYISGTRLLGGPKSENFMYALDANTGEEKWKFQTDSSAYAPAVDDGIVYFADGWPYIYAVK